MSTASERMFALAASFPTLRDLPGVVEWDPIRLDEEAAKRGGAVAVSAAFVLDVWNNGVPWKVGHFSVGRAMRLWDAEHRRAFQAWAEEPFLP